MHATSPTAVAAPPTVSAPRPRWIDDWRPEDRAFWAATGERVARRNLVFSIFSEHIGFCVWSMWSAFVLFLGPEYGFDPAQKFLLTTVPTAVGAALRIPYTLAVARFGGRNWTVASALLLLVPSIAAGIALEPGVSFGTLLFVAALAGIGGGNFSSSMANIDAFFPQRLKGWALGLNAGGGNIGVAAVQLVGLAVLATAGAGSPRLILVVYIPLIVVAAACAALFMDNLTCATNDERAHARRRSRRSHLDHLVPLHRHVRLVHRLRLRLRPGPPGAVRRDVRHADEGGRADVPRPAARLARPSARRPPGGPSRRLEGHARWRSPPWPPARRSCSRTAARLQMAGGWRRVSAGPRRGRWPRASSPRRCCREVPAPAG